VKKSSSTTAITVTPEDWPLDRIRHFEPNPRRIETADFVVLCRSIAAFGLVDTLVIAEDGRALGGNQRLDALLQLQRGFDAPRADDPSKTERLQWSPPGGLVHVMVVRGASETQLKAINVALNKHAGTFIPDQLAAVLREVRDYDAALLGAIDTDAEIDRLLRDPALGGGDPPRTTGVPSITLRFTSAAAHTRVKQRLAAAQERHGKAGEKTPSGDLLDALLGGAPKPPRAPKVDKPGPKKAAPRARA